MASALGGAGITPNFPDPFENEPGNPGNRERALVTEARWCGGKSAAGVPAWLFSRGELWAHRCRDDEVGMKREVVVTAAEPEKEDKQTARIGRMVGEPVERFCARALSWG